MSKSHSLLLSNRIQLAVHIFAFVFVLSSLFVYQTVSAAGDKDKGERFAGRHLEYISEKLNLTDQQKDQIAHILSEAREQAKQRRQAMKDERKAMKGKDMTEEEREAMKKQRAEMRRAHRQAVEQQIMSVLTEQQRVEYAKLKEEFKGKMKEKRNRKGKGRGNDRQNDSN